MENFPQFPQHFRDNAIFFYLNDYMNFDVEWNQNKVKIQQHPKLYIMDNKKYFAVSLLIINARTFFPSLYVCRFVKANDIFFSPKINITACCKQK